MIKIVVERNKLFACAETKEEKEEINKIIERANETFKSCVQINQRTITGTKEELFNVIYMLTRLENYYVKIL